MTVGIYVRVSTREQAEKGYSIPEQTERAESYCKAKGWTSYRVYADPGFTGANMKRPGLISLTNDVKSGIIQIVLVYKLDRLSRSQLDTLFLIEKVFLANGADFVSMSESFDTSTPFGRAMLGILAVFAQLERETIKERMTMGKIARAKSGKNTSSIPPIGYDLIDGKLIPNEYEKIQIIELFELYSSGFSPLQIERIFEKKGYSTKYGKWKAVTIRKIIPRKTYIGMSPYGHKWYDDEHEPLISTDLFEKAQSVRIRKSDEFFDHTHYAGEATSYLAGLLYCGNCGAKYSKETSRTRSSSGKDHVYEYYTCQSRTRKAYRAVKDINCRNRRIKMEELDRIIFDEIRKLSVDPDYVAAIQDKKQDENRVPVLQSELKKIESQIEKMIGLFSLGSMPQDILQKQVEELNEKRKSLTDELSSISINDNTNSDRIRAVLTDFSIILDKGTIEEVRTALYALISKIVIFEDDIEIHWNF